ncbi:MAG TPA: glycosyltransferase family 4 protein [Ferruginibacter sp.]|nr:glycosyltransferase family 4 protein [Ferruginibacter sp.]HRO05962.1 glycosyltransferase family 4 protein [Ferruginibacter sp.]HRO97221.1 glycosyltransferase family 4 protein [Ferruginibacter sp.]HRP49048.1 glycosyltransferase family 4 protein [Ferruginibacter sp.]
MKHIAILENNIIATHTIRNTLTRRLMEEGYRVTVLTTGAPESLELARQQGFTVIDVKSSNQNPLDIFRYISGIRSVLKSIQPDVCLTFTIRPAIWGNFVTRRLNIPTITNITGIGPLFERNNLAYRAARTLYKFILKKTAVIFFQNTDDRALFIENKFVTPEKARLIPGSGIDYRYYAPMHEVPLAKPFLFLFISRLIKDKGVLEYVEAARMLKGKINARFQMIGPIWLQNLKDNIISLEDVRRWEKEGIIEYAGEQQDVRPFIAAASAVVLPSYREGTSNVLLEASAMEKPCITCDTTGCREVVSDGVTGYLCEVRNAADLAQKMEQMFHLSPEEQTAMGKRAREKVIREFDKQIVVDAYLQAIRSVIKD